MSSGGLGADDVSGGTQVDSHHLLLRQLRRQRTLRRRDRHARRRHQRRQQRGRQRSRRDNIGSDVENITGAGGNDTLNGSSLANILVGGAGADTLLGLGGDDRLDGGTENDILDAAGGHNTLIGGDGNDTLSSLEGNDSLNGGNNDDDLDAGAGNNILDAGAGNDSLSVPVVTKPLRWHGNDALMPVQARTSSTPAPGPTTCSAATARPRHLLGPNGEPKRHSRRSPNEVEQATTTDPAATTSDGLGEHHRGTGNDTLSGSPATSPHGNNGNDTLVGLRRQQHLQGGGGNDGLSGLDGSKPHGGTGNDTSTPAPATTPGRGSAQTTCRRRGHGPRRPTPLREPSPDDHVDGNANDGGARTQRHAPRQHGDIENVTGGGGPTRSRALRRNVLNGNQGRRRARRQHGRRRPDRGRRLGGDRAFYGNRSSGVTVTLSGGADDGNAQDDNGSRRDNTTQVEQVSGGFGNDNLTGTTGPNVLSGAAGNDTIDGLAGTDNLIGGVGADDIVGGPGTDSTTYGPGFSNNDHFAAVTVTLDGTANDGSSEDDNGSRRDNIGVDVENITGGNGNDPSRQLGDNVLTGGAGADSLFGLDGNDTLMARDGVADTTIDCGPGSDSAQINAGDPAPVGCETVTSG